MHRNEQVMRDKGQRDSPKQLLSEVRTPRSRSSLLRHHVLETPMTIRTQPTPCISCVDITVHRSEIPDEIP
ncbi:hypothetical protein SCP_0901400 [Sparassis crispa]|uniref:Uncharacterized protein n=1 Tax=Sparassis crispa TaxID=139825 RepID=A0A401GVK5_9APHY|nr:hypothetical protein SCP_0901400 [Sparassis crispa]GBE86261.1 hypothetical protein SCP_0901400 [Sparassis crispa]